MRDLSVEHEIKYLPDPSKQTAFTGPVCPLYRRVHFVGMAVSVRSIRGKAFLRVVVNIQLE